MRNESRTAYLNIPRLALDTALVVVSWGAAALAGRVVHPTLEPLAFAWIPLLYALSFLSVMNGLGLYDLTAPSSPHKTLRGVVAACVVAILIPCLMLPFEPFVPSRRIAMDLLAFMSLAGLTFLGIRYFLTFPQANRATSQRAVHTLFVGEPDAIRTYMENLGKTSFRVRPIGCLTDHGVRPLEDLPVLGDIDDLSGVLAQNVVDEVVLAWNRENNGRVSSLLKICTEHGVLTRVALDVWQAGNAHSHMHTIGSLPVLVYHRSHLSTPQQTVKRGLDMLAGVIGLLVFALSALVLVPIIRRSTRQPAFAWIDRIGRNGRSFRQLRYRICKQGANLATRNAEEMTRVGRFLYRSRLHYLPSFWNVLTGTMSLVGIRGTNPGATSQSAQEASHEALPHIQPQRQLKAQTQTKLAPTNHQPAPRKISLKPGLTGLWHVWDFDRLLDEAGLQELDETYAANWSLWLDIRILLQTPVIAVIHRIIGHMPGGEVPS
jgi:lipopolysaccharide/colanic/teichoic acid biosynthesis glycosyltransferase